ncbi:hypothetical protein F8S13_23285 [Chloroflexia bacterium SDU3-3]|nr:hypothetical protein F8S13_23285 [Chloroflexia bacterium SDU3-3]
MGITTTYAEQLLFTGRDGSRSAFQDVVRDGLDGGLDDRIAGLGDVVRGGSPYHALLACAALTAWGHELGFQTLIGWATAPDRTPWAGEPVVYHPASGTDAAFETLADAVGRGAASGLTPGTRYLRVAALRAMLRIYHGYYFDRTLAIAVGSSDAAQLLHVDLRAAFERCLPLLRDQQPPFDLGFQLACLLVPLAHVDDEAAAGYACQLLETQSHSRRVLRQLALAMTAGGGPASQAVAEALRAAAPMRMAYR